MRRRSKLARPLQSRRGFTFSPGQPRQARGADPTVAQFDHAPVERLRNLAADAPTRLDDNAAGGAPRAAQGLDLVSAGEPGIWVARAILPYLQELRARARRMGATFRVTSGYRSASQQRQLQVRWEAGDPDVVAPPAPNSLHLLGLAFDVESDALPALGLYAEGIGLRWGGRFQDPVHFDLGRR